jgi:anti-anti-sigma regulatory factor
LPETDVHKLESDLRWAVSGSHYLIIDVSQVASLNAEAVDVLVKTNRSILTIGGIRLVRPSAAVKTTLQSTKRADYFFTFNKYEAAMKDILNQEFLPKRKRRP